MGDPTTRFSSRVDNYIKHRPGYPPGLLAILAEHHGLTPASTIADLGSGTGILTLSVLKGLFAEGTAEPVSYVNAPQLAAERGLEVRETSTVTAHDFVNLITLRGGGHSVAGTLAGPRSEPRLVMVDDHTVEVPPAPHMVVVRNDDRPGMIGVVGTILGDADVSISSMAVGPSATANTALMVLSTDGQVPDSALAQLRDAAGISDVHTVRT